MFRLSLVTLRLIFPLWSALLVCWFSCASCFPSEVLFPLFLVCLFLLGLRETLTHSAWKELVASFPVP